MDYRPGGLARLRGDGFTAYLQLARDDGNPARIRVSQITVVPDDGQPVTEAMLRAIPMAEIELHLVMLASVTIRPLPGDVGSELSADLVMRPARVKGYDPAALERYFGDEPPVPLGSVIPGRTGLSRPPGGRLTDQYLRDVAAVYLAAIRAKRPPAPAVAEAAGVPVRTVHRWIADARARGILPATTRGKAG